jgi:hypothetical protein
MSNPKKHENLPMGFDRTQLFKEFQQPQINRSAGLSAALEVCTLNDVKMTNREILALAGKYVEFIENGNTEWAKKVDEYMAKKNLV